MPSEHDIAAQCERLVLYRQNVQQMLQQITAQGGWIYAPVALLNALSDNRREIARCKATLRGWRVPVDDHPDDDATSDIGALEQQAAELEASRATLQGLVLQLVQQALVGVQERREALKQIETTVSISGGAGVHGAVLGVNQGTVQVFFGGQPPENGAALLDAYLDALGRECEHLRLSRLTGKRQSGADQRADPPLRLQAVYTSLTTDGPPVVLHRRLQKIERLNRLWKRLDKDRTPDNVPPEDVRGIQISQTFLTDNPQRDRDLSDVDKDQPDAPCELRIIRPELALEAIAHQRRLVLLGEPGAGKSTVLRYLALLLAQRLRGGAPLPGWPADDLPIPILCPLGRVAAALSEHNGNADKALKQVLGELLEGEHGQCEGLRGHLQPALRGAGVLLLFDGLDELPAEASSGGTSPRAAIAQAIRNLERWTKARIVVTSRVLPYHAPGDWQLAPGEGWQVRTLAPLAFGQVRTFVTSWYAALADTGSDPELDSGRAQARAEALIAELEDSPNLRPLVASPLLLTMLAILHYNTNEVPRDRARLYEECVQLLLERWEPVRTPGLRRPGLLERLGHKQEPELLDLLRSVLHELAFQAHDQPPGDDGRGLIDGDRLRGRMLRLFERVRNPNPARALTTFVQTLREDAGLLLELGDGQYTFPHLTFQEYLAACHLADLPAMAEEIQQRWHGPDAERWRVVLRLLVGRLRQQGKLHDKLIPWLQRLIASHQGTQPKPVPARRRDTALAVLLYEELGTATLAGSAPDVPDLINKLRVALLDLLAVHDPAISTADRVRAGFLLGELGDPRFPITLEQWRAALAQVQAGDTSGYFCRVEAGTYWIGSTDDDPEADEREKPRHAVTFDQPFWIGRFPITNAQWQAWVEDGGEASYYADNSNVNHPNQPVVGITWQMAVAFCTWLSTQLGFTVRLPHEAEWEAAARGQEERRYPWGDAWADDRAATREDQEARGWRWSVPVGCYSAGAAACGAQDLAGNVWEWTADVWQSYPGAHKPFRDGNVRVLRGGSYAQERTLVRCGARDWVRHVSYLNFGFRVVVGPERAGR
ncbi:MAG: hypothetical protein OHK0022_38180 [Roseiflexaceae bacterium]